MCIDTQHIQISFVYSVDINECASSNGGCDQTCTDNVGSFQCSCLPGFRLAIDQQSCTGECSYHRHTSVVDNLVYRVKHSYVYMLYIVMVGGNTLLVQ